MHIVSKILKFVSKIHVLLSLYMIQSFEMIFNLYTIWADDCHNIIGKNNSNINSSSISLKVTHPKFVGFITLEESLSITTGRCDLTIATHARKTHKKIFVVVQPKVLDND